jgi:DNA-binding GntR family transcriptional regulator
LIQVEDVRGGKTTFADMAYKYLLSRILSHTLKPGESLRVKDLAAEMRLSITPVSRAIDRLIGEGFLEIRPGLGPYVRSPSVQNILELFDARCMCEIHAVQRGMQNIDDTFLQKMASLVEAYEVAFAARDGAIETRIKAAEVGRDLHLHILSLWPNEYVLSWYTQMNVHIRCFQLARANYMRRDSATQEHRSIYQALANQDCAGAVEALHQHNEEAKKFFLLNVQETIRDMEDNPENPGGDAKAWR